MESYYELLEKQKAYYHSGATKELSFRMQALQTLGDIIRNHEKEFTDALKEDLNKSEFDAYLMEIGYVIGEIGFTMKHLRKWMKPRKVKTPVTHIGSSSYIYPEPYGSVLIISPWNYPFQLAVAPLIGAIAAGNCAVLKPSELTPATSEVMAKHIRKNYPEEFVSIVEGGVETSTALLKEKFDYIFFTGSVSVGKIVMEAASKHLTPVTLELGGKSPCIVHKDANLQLAAKRMVWGKFINAGQTCIAPDYLYVHEEVKEKLLQYMIEFVQELYGPDPLQNPNYTRIVSDRHFQRLARFMNDGKVLVGGRSIAERRIIEPTILDQITWDDSVMQDEIFGPILPVLDYRSLEDLIKEINQHPKPLALYLFSESQDVQQEIIQRISFGGGCVNDTLFHVANPYLPFGGVGESGVGAYHGKGSFDTFSHEKGILKQTTKFDIPIRYPNVKDGLRKLRWIFK